MKKSIPFLPHWCQIVGYSYLIAFLVVLFLLVVFAKWLPAPIRDFASFFGDNWNIIGPVNMLMVILAIFSKDKVEDEMSRDIRVKVLVAIALFIFVCTLLLYIPVSTGFGSAFRDFYETFINDIGIVFIAYAMLYKIIIWICQWRARNEE